jgi:type II secretory ATPase GspE/PulE/Tfp pilus assembly ATPase PilB-like protein
MTTMLRPAASGGPPPDRAAAAQILGQNECFHHMIAPLDKQGHEVFVAALDDNDAIRAGLAQLGTALRVTIVIAEVHSRETIRDMIRAAFPNSESRAAATSADGAGLSLLREILEDAVKLHTSDIHIEPAEDGGRIRLRIDRSLREVKTVNGALYRQLLAVLKTRAKLKIDVTRSFQDGSFEETLASAREVDVRVNVIPLANTGSEKAVLRLLGNAAVLRSFGELGIPDRMAQKYAFLIKNNNALHLVAGPTNSGKTTTVFAIVSEADESQNVLTVEDPVEIRLRMAYQVSVNPAAGVTFASAMRNFLRDDPDIVVCGELRDSETADVCALAGLAGHSTWSTIHSPDAIRAVQRLIEFGVARGTLAQALKTVLAQRLIRRLCRICRVEEVIPVRFRSLYVGPYEETTGVRVGRIYRKATLEEIKARGGCPTCGNTGIAGLVGAFELFVVDEEIEDAIVRGESRAALYRIARNNDYVPLRHHAAELIMSGVTSIEEVNRQYINLDPQAGN